jgi:hypothetical protein
VDTLRKNLRANLSEIAHLFSSDNTAKEFQLQVPHVFAPTELFCMWFDDTYMPKDFDFIAAFSQSEHEAISAFNGSLETLSQEAGNQPPPLESLFRLPSWAEVKLRANTVLEILNA